MPIQSLGLRFIFMASIGHSSHCCFRGNFMTDMQIALYYFLASLLLFFILCSLGGPHPPPSLYSLFNNISFITDSHAKAALQSVVL